MPAGTGLLKIQLWDGAVDFGDLLLEGQLDLATFSDQANFDMRVDSTIVSQNLQLVFTRWDEQMGWLPVHLFPGTFTLQKLEFYRKYQWDYHNRITKAEIYSQSMPGDSNPYRLLSTVEYEYDVLGNRIAKQVKQNDSGNNLQPLRDELYVNENGQVLLQGDYLYHEGSPYLARETHSLWSQAVDQLLATDERRYDVDGNLIADSDRLVWALTDHQGTVRDLIELSDSGALEQEHLTYGVFGQPLTCDAVFDAYGTPADPTALSAAVSARYGGREYDYETELSYNRARYYAPTAGRFLSEDPLGFAGGDLNLYRYAGNTPTSASSPSGSGAGYLAQGGNAHWTDFFWEDFSYYIDPVHNDPGVMGNAFMVGKFVGWGMAVMGGISAAAVGGTAIAGGATVSSLFSVGTVGAGAYFGKSAIVSGVETGIETSIAYATRDDSFNAAYAFGRNFAINSAIGFVPGAAEGRMAAKAGRLGLNLGARFGDDAARWGYRAGRYAVHAGRDIAVGTAADTAWAVGIEGSSVGNAVTQSFVGNFAGQGIGDLLSTGIRRVMPHITSPGRICFAAGTLVELANAETESVFVPIEEVRLGGRVHTDAPLEVAASISAQRAFHAHSRADSTTPSTGVVSDSSDDPPSQFNSSQWRVVTLRLISAEDSDVEVTLLRPLLWLSLQDAFPGSVIYLDLPELNTSGPMRVDSIETAPPVQPGPGAPVTGTFRHTAHELAEVRLEGLDEPIRCTPRHPFWSVTRHGWVPASELQPDDALLSTTGAITKVQSAVVERAEEPVYNIEVDGAHVYRVSSSGVLVHNASFDGARSEILSARHLRLLDEGIGFRTFGELKDYLGPPPPGHAWHHIVGQNADNIARFGPEYIHNTASVIAIPHGKGSTHLAQIEAFLNSHRPEITGQGFKRVRDWVKTKSYQFQYEFGVIMLRNSGVPLP